MPNKDTFVALARQHKDQLAIPTCRETEGRMEYVVTHGIPNPTRGTILDPVTGDPIGQWMQVPHLVFEGDTIAESEKLRESMPSPPQREYRNYLVFFKKPGILTRRCYRYSDGMDDQLGVTNGVTILEDGNLWLVRGSGKITRLWIDPDSEAEVKLRILAVLPEDLSTQPILLCKNVI